MRGILFYLRVAQGAIFGLFCFISAFLIFSNNVGIAPFSLHGYLVAITISMLILMGIASVRLGLENGNGGD